MGKVATQAPCRLGGPHHFGAGGRISTLPICGPLLIPPPALKRWAPPRRHGLCSHLAHLWATSDSATRSEAVGTPQAAAVM